MLNAPAIAGAAVSMDASALMMAALAVQAGMEAGTEAIPGGIEMQDDDLADEMDNGLEDMLPVEEAIGEEDILDAAIQQALGDGAGDTEEDEEPVTQ